MMMSVFVVDSWQETPSVTCICMWLKMSFVLWSLLLWSCHCLFDHSIWSQIFSSCPGVGFQPTPNRRDWTGWRNSTRLFWTFTHGTEHQQPKQKVSSPLRPAVGTWGRAYCNCITQPNPVRYLLRYSFCCVGSMKASWKQLSCDASMMSWNQGLSSSSQSYRKWAALHALLIKI